MLTPARLLQALIRVVVWLVVIVALMPLIFMVTTSLKPATFPTAIPPQWIFVPTLEHYIGIFRQGFGQYLLHSTVTALVSTALALSLGLAAAYALARIHFPGSRLLSMWILSTIMMPPVVVVIPIFIVVARLGLLDTYPALIAPYTAGNLPVVIFLLRNAILQVPSEIEDSARVDGCTRLGIMLRIIAPLIVPSIATAAMLTVIGCWNEFLFASALTRTNVLTGPVGLMTYAGEFSTDWGSITAGATTIVVPMLVLAIVLRRRFVSGLTAGAVTS
jgi:multiple sugar transport system permease protein/sorbitol/mannitol transport system permease protein